MMYDFKDINLIPKKCIVDSRSECSTAVVLGRHTFKLPVVPANMECVINKEIAYNLAKNGYFYTYHRFGDDTVDFADMMHKHNLPVSISLGVNADAYSTLKSLTVIPDYITIDIAHGHSDKMKNIIEFIKKTMPSTFIIAGNVSTPMAVEDLEAWGADAIKVGIGPGSACTTYVATGFGSRGAQASIIESCAKAKKKSSTLIFADGGVVEPGDIVKCLALGASMVMIGGMFSSLLDSPGTTVAGTDGRMYKEFWGSASSFQSGKQTRIEGTKKLMPLKNRTIIQEMNYIQECIQSAISYGGGNSLECFKSVNYFIKI